MDGTIIDNTNNFTWATAPPSSTWAVWH